MKAILAASPALLLAGAMFAAPVSAQTMAPDINQPMASPYAGTAGSQPYAEQGATQSYAGQALSNQLITTGPPPRGPYLSECKDVRMLQDTLTAFCPRGDGTWHTTQLLQASSCPGGVANAGGDLVCSIPPQIGSTSPPRGYASSYGGTYGPAAAPPPAIGYGGTYQPMMPPAPGYPSPYPPVPSQTYAAPTYNDYGAYNPYGAYPPTANEYVSPSATRTAQPPY
jgi:hypothetical protein